MGQVPAKMFPQPPGYGANATPNSLNQASMTPQAPSFQAPALNQTIGNAGSGMLQPAKQTPQVPGRNPRWPVGTFGGRPGPGMFYGS